ncbi:hypothetical protein GA0070616_0985 [Micromonospora nigra]|uniref:Uncharacterized protein n=1 Tax=Micromonospora nigra TaxID=145857 RepID=A0A1C6RGT7_9ACTN|nr:hypothetical protein [Micromonospora nigra]SCL16299.1 hypothetical protein GA0070616_0985 [Micromonospora nigra]
MGTTEPGSAREEAERLVATVLATARIAAAAPGAGQWGPLGGIVSGVLGHNARSGASDAGSSTGFTTGAAEWAVCPVCRGIAALRDPSPEFAERLATGAGDLAAGLASFLRAFAPADTPSASPPESADGATPAADADHVWREATRSGHDSPSAPERDVWSAATRAGDVVVPAAAAPPVDAAGPAAAVPVRTSAERPVVPVSREPGDEESAPGDGA